MLLTTLSPLLLLASLVQSLPQTVPSAIGTTEGNRTVEVQLYAGPGSDPDTAKTVGPCKGIWYYRGNRQPYLCLNEEDEVPYTMLFEDHTLEAVAKIKATGYNYLLPTQTQMYYGRLFNPRGPYPWPNELKEQPYFSVDTSRNLSEWRTDPWNAPAGTNVKFYICTRKGAKATVRELVTAKMLADLVAQGYGIEGCVEGFAKAYPQP